MGAKNEVFLNDSKKEIILNFKSKNKFDFFLPKGIVLSDGEIWSEQRRFAVRTLKDFGLGNSGGVTGISFEVQQLVQLLESQIVEKNSKTPPIDPRLMLNKSVANVICVLVFGERLGDDPEFSEMAKIITDIVLPFMEGSPILMGYIGYVEIPI